MSDHVTKVKEFINKMDENNMEDVRHHLEDRLLQYKETTQGSADASADDEKKKWIAQHGTNPIAQTTAQNVPSPVSDEVKDLQNEKAREEHDAKGHAADLSH